MTKIEWTHRPGTTGVTWNPVTGCTKVSEGCAHCYAERMSHRLAGRCGYPAAPNQFDVTLHPDRLGKPHHWRKPRTVFVPSMGDLFHEDVPFEYIDRVIIEIMWTPRHTYIILTKRARRMQRYFADLLERLDIKDRWIQYNAAKMTGMWPIKNLWLVVSAENQEMADERTPWLLKTPAAIRGVSVEPMLGPVDLTNLPNIASNGDLFDALNWRYGSREHKIYAALGCCSVGRLDWVICGGESGPGARPMHPDWARGLRDQCQEAGTPFFFKQWGAWLPYRPSTYGYYTPLEGCYTDDGTKWPARQRVLMPYEIGGAWADERFVCARKVGKKRAGRLLDGREWNEWPEATQ